MSQLCKWTEKNANEPGKFPEAPWVSSMFINSRVKLPREIHEKIYNTMFDLLMFAFVLLLLVLI